MEEHPTAATNAITNPNLRMAYRFGRRRFATVALSLLRVKLVQAYL